MKRRKYDEFNYVPQKKLHNYCFYEPFTTGNQRVYDWKSTSLLSGDDSLNYLHVHHTIIIETIIIKDPI